MEKKHNNSLKSLSLKKNFSWILLGNIVFAISQWGILIVLNRLGNAEMVGLYTLGLAIVSPVILFTNLQLRSVQATETRSKFSFNDFIALRIISCFFAIIIVTLLMVFSNYTVSTIFIVIFLMVLKIVDAFSDINYGFLQQKEIMDKIGISLIWRGVLSVTVLAITLFLTANLMFGIISMIVSWLFVLIYYDYKIINNLVNIKITFNKDKVWNIFKLAFPLGLVTMIGSLSTHFPRIYLESYTDLKSLGYFASISYLMVAGNTFINALGQAATPRLAFYYANNNIEKFKGLLKKLFIFSFLLGTLGVLVSFTIGDYILILLYGNEYYGLKNIFILIMIGGFFLYCSSFFGNAITSARYFKVQPFLSLFWLFITIISSIIFIPKYGLLGASLVLIFNGIAQLFSKSIVVMYILKK